MSGAEEIESVVKSGGDINTVNTYGYTPLMHAANLGLLDNVKTLIKLGADVDYQGPERVTAIALATYAKARLLKLQPSRKGQDEEKPSGNIRRAFRSPAITTHLNKNIH